MHFSHGHVECELALELRIRSRRSLLLPHLGPFLPGKRAEETSKKAEAIIAYQKFSGHFERSAANLP
jgi:hypothetical protein